jgi:hypothetical protein
MKVTPTSPFYVQRKKVVLLDVPGFDDIYSSDMDRLDEIASYLTDTYVSKLPLTQY